MKMIRRHGRGGYYPTVRGPEGGYASYHCTFDPAEDPKEYLIRTILANGPYNTLVNDKVLISFENPNTFYIAKAFDDENVYFSDVHEAINYAMQLLKEVK